MTDGLGVPEDVNSNKNGINNHNADSRVDGNGAVIVGCARRSSYFTRIKEVMILCIVFK